MIRYIQEAQITAAVYNAEAAGYKPNLIFGGKVPMPFKIQLGDHHWRRVYRNGFEGAKPYVTIGKCHYTLTAAAEYKMKTLATRDRGVPTQLEAMAS